MLSWVGEFSQLLMRLGMRSSDGRMLYCNGVACCVAMGGKASDLNNSLWDWESGLQEVMMLYCNRLACCIVVDGMMFV